MEIKLSPATKAFIVYDQKVLLLKESAKYEDGMNAGKFDVVGGRVKPGQRFDKSLIREIQEEIGLIARIGNPFFVNEWRPVVNGIKPQSKLWTQNTDSSLQQAVGYYDKIKGEPWQIVGIFFECFADTDKVVLSKDHEEYIWIDPKEYKKYNLIDGLIPAFAR